MNTQSPTHKVNLGRSSALQTYWTKHVKKYKPQGEGIVDIEEDLLIEKRKDNNFIETIEEARQKLEGKLARIEKLCGGFAESTVCLILKGVK